MSRYSNYSSYGNRDYSSSSYSSRVGRTPSYTARDKPYSSKYDTSSYSTKSPYTSKYSDNSDKYNRDDNKKMEEDRLSLDYFRSDGSLLTSGTATTENEKNCAIETSDVLNKGMAENDQHEDDDDQEDDEDVPYSDDTTSDSLRTELNTTFIHEEKEEKEKEEKQEVEEKTESDEKITDEPAEDHNGSTPNPNEHSHLTSKIVVLKHSESLEDKRMKETTWPPKTENMKTEKKKELGIDAVPKKRVSQLIARFNSCNFENNTNED